MYCEPQLCDCGKERDLRASKCWTCAGRDIEIDPLHFRLVIANSNSYLKASKVLGVSRQTVKRRCDELNLDVTHMRGAKGRVADNELYLCVGTKRINSTVRRIILRDNLIEYICTNGHPPVWNGQPLTLELEHKNGNPCDNRLENLEFLCPNCHAQTDTSRGKNSRKKAV